MSAYVPVAYDRAVLVDVLVYHYRRNYSSCGCGWAELGKSHPEHVAIVYEESITARTRVEACAVCGRRAGCDEQHGHPIYREEASDV